LGNVLGWIYDHEPRFDNFARDIWRTRRRLEALLSEGERQTPGIQCPRCRQAAMIRTEHDRSKPRDCGGHGPLETCPIPRQGCCERGGLIEQWSCPECGHRLANTPEHAEYDEAVFKDYIGSAPYLEGKYVERRTNVPIGTVRVWVQRGYVRTRKDARDTLVYCITDIEARFAGNRAIDLTEETA
jgi:DNA-directed RNA polymerase subunit RPC12/RpoP